MPFLCVTHNDPANFVLSLPYRFTFPGHPQAELLLQYNSTRNLCNLRSGQVANDKKEEITISERIGLTTKAYLFYDHWVKSKNAAFDCWATSRRL